MTGSKIVSASALFAAVVLTLGMTGSASSEDGHSWKYGPKGSDANWSSTCKIGRLQSPIDVPSFGLGNKNVRPISFNYTRTAGTTITNNGHTLQVTVPKGNSVTIGGETYQLAQFHFHTPSEHLLAGNRYPMEVHLVHVDERGSPKLVVGIFIDKDLEKGATANNVNDPTASRLIGGLPLPTRKGETVFSGTIDLLDLMPVDRRGRRNEHAEFSGSLTTPGCTEGLTWIVMGTALQTTPDVIARYQAIMGENYRQVQALNNRTIFCCGER